MKKKLLIFIAILIFSLPSITHLFQQGFFQTDDGEWMIIRFSAFHQTLRDGQLPVRFLERLNHGYGYPVANFLYPGFMYLAEPIYILGFGLVNTIKIIIGLSMVLSAVFTFLWLRRIFDDTSSFVGSLFYIYTPYHLYDLYTRGSVGELMALAVVPFTLWNLERHSIFWSTIGIFMLVLSHNTLALLFLPLLFVYCLVRKFPLKNTLIQFLLGTAMSSFFSISAITDLHQTQFLSAQIADYKQYFAGIELIGVSTIFIISLVAVTLISKKMTLKKEGILFFVVVLFSLFLSMEMSSKIWEVLPSAVIQFPFRLLSYVVVAISFLSAFVIYNKIIPQKILIVLSLGILAFSAFPYLKNVEFFDKGDDFYATNEATTTVKDEYMYIGTQTKPTQRFSQKVEIIQGKGVINNLISDSKTVEFDIQDAMQNTLVRVNTSFFNGWNAKVDGKEQPIKINTRNGSVMEFSVNEGDHHVRFSFLETPLRIVSDIISLASFCILVVISLRNYKLRRATLKI